MVMWIVLGSLVGLVAIFLVVTSILDRKKRKKIKLENDKLQSEIENSYFGVVVLANQILDANEKILKSFIPSVGKLKMSDIRLKGKNAIKLLQAQREYKLSKDEPKNQKLFDAIDELWRTNSNVWVKTMSVTFLRKEFDKADKTKYEELIKEFNLKLKEEYKK